MTRILFCAIAIWSVLVAAPALAEPIDAALRTKLLEIYERFNAAVNKGDFRAAMATRDRTSRLIIESQARTEADRKTFIEMNRLLVPSKLDVQDGEVSGDTARLEAVASLLPMRQLGSATAEGLVREQVSLEFRREGGFWRFAGSTTRTPAAKAQTCDENMPEPETAFDDRSDVSIDGSIKRVNFADDYTAIVVDVVGEENCLYLPNKASLQKAGLDTDLLEPRAMLEAEGHRHKSDSQKAWVTGMKVTKR